MAAESMIEVIFVGEPGVREGGDFKKGKSYKMSAASAARWIKRGRAIKIDDYKAVKKPAK